MKPIYSACVLGLRDYVDNNRFPGVVLGLSGGVDSALCAAMAVDALGKERVHAVMLPYLFTSSEALETPPPALRRSASATTSCRSPSRSRALEHALAKMFDGRAATSRKRTSRARARGLILMAISNKTRRHAA